MRAHPVQDDFPEACATDIAVLVPARQPGTQLISLVAALIAEVSAVVVVDDGSGEEYCGIFDALEAMHSVYVLRHPVNRGKGCALKSGLDFVLTRLPDVSGVVTADADGQHRVSDILNVAEALHTSGRFVLGSRRLASNVPLRSRFGNTLTRYLFRILSGHDVRDTQSGLRGFPRQQLADLLTLRGERYDYEMNVLAHLCRTGALPVQVPIATVYHEHNAASHFQPVRDSIRVYLMLMRSRLRL